MKGKSQHYPGIADLAVITNLAIARLATSQLSPISQLREQKSKGNLIT
jgi:hypothetical protein